VLCGRKRSRPNLKYCPSTCLQDLSKTVETLSAEVCFLMIVEIPVDFEVVGSNNGNIRCFPQRLRTNAGIVLEMQATVPSL
jgi:hypothetical protein